VSTETSKIVPQNEKARSIWRHQRALCEQVDSDSPEPWQPIVELLDQIDALCLALAASQDEAEKAKAELGIRTRQRDYWQDDRQKIRQCFDLVCDRLRWCATNQVQFGLEEGASGQPDRWIVYQKNRWDLPLGEGVTYEAAIDAARADAARKEPPAKAHGCEVGE
jgi:hypothetical protein